MAAMDETFLHTTDHETIRAWIEDNDAFPVEITSDEGVRVIELVFGEPVAIEGVTKLLWEEFFDRFDTEGYVFEYLEEIVPGEEATAYNFLTASEAAEKYNNETELPDPSDLAKENLDNEFSEDTVDSDETLGEDLDSI
jgi:hypothetical protein